jgi:hypothetical protein
MYLEFESEVLTVLAHVSLNPTLMEWDPVT